MESIVLSAFSAVAVDHAVQVLTEGGMVVVPTDTVYGLAAALNRPEAIENIYRVKGRPPERPIALLVDRIDDVLQVAADLPEPARRLMERFWPGGLTLTLPRKSDVPDIVTAGGPTVAVRLPDHPTPRAIIRRLGAPLPTTSANRSGAPSPTTAEEARAQLNGAVPLVLDAGPAPGGTDSTVLDLCADQPRVLRVGAVSVAELEAVLGLHLQVPAG
jgi:L-threonylcarbamoyladenylate synthase